MSSDDHGRIQVAITGRHAGLALAIVALTLALFVSPVAAQETALIEFGASMLYLDNQDDPGIGMTWTEDTFDDTGWTVGQYGVGYETNGGASSLLLTTVPNTTRTVYTRITFTINDVSQIQNLFIGADYDDGYAAWINGVEVHRADLPAGALDWNTPTTGEHESSNGTVPAYELQEISTTGIPALRNGENVLAIGVWNIGLGSSDLVLVPWLSFNRELQVTRGPYLQQGTPDSMIVRWRTSYATDSRVEFGDAPGNLVSSVVDPTPTTEHEVVLSGLDPETRYYYAVGSSTGMLAGDDANHHFLTSPSTGAVNPVRVWVMGDFGEGTPNAMAVRDAYYNHTGATHTDLWLMLGDNAMPAGTDIEYQTKVFEIYDEILRKTVAWPTLGNHDSASSDSPTQSGPYYEAFSLPTGAEAGGVASGTEAYYSFDYGNIHFVVLDSQDTNRAVGAAMLTWLEQDLAATVQDWIIAYWHHPPYSKGSHDSDTELQMVEMRENAVPILEDYGVDLVFSGHSHDYERSFFIDGHYGDSTTFDESHKVQVGDGREDGDGAYAKPNYGPDPHSGTVYTVAGSGAKVTGGTLDHPAMYLSLNLIGSVVLDINDTRLDAAFIDHTGQELDHFTLKKGPDCPDQDGDRVCDSEDNCPTDPNDGQADADSDGRGDICDACINDPLDDIDSDGICGDLDNCPLLSNPPQTDTDQDGAGDACDLDDDNDGVADGADCAPLYKGVASPPGLVGSTLVLDKFGGTRLKWVKAPQGHTSSVYRAQASAPPTGEMFSCRLSESPESELRDPQLVPVGEIFFYLIAGVNACGEGLAGVSDAGLPRTGWPSCPPMSGDFDVDGLPDVADNCAEYPNSAQADFDLDFVGDICDNCMFSSNEKQLDCNDDGIGNQCDSVSDCDADLLVDNADNCPDFANPGQQDEDTDGVGDACDACPGDPINDPDNDLICGSVDNCPLVANNDQADRDADSLGDLCDTCPDDTLNDVDSDAVCGDTDNCPTVSNAPQNDADSDTIGDVCDVCPLDATNDADSDTICGEVDNCPATPNGTQEDTDSDTFGDACDVCPLDAANDADSDTVCGDVDNCPVTPNGTQEDTDSDAFGDACDVCPLDAGNDADSDTICGDVDNCPATPNGTQEDTDSDTFGDVCDSCPLDAANDADSDTICGDVDNCPTTPNTAQDDVDSDTLGDACDVCPLDAANDADSDTVCGDVDNCPGTPNTAQDDVDSDTFGDACDSCPLDAANDADSDTICGDVDNCPATPNAAQDDVDSDTLGDACDVCPLDAANDTDNDTICGDVDNCPATPNTTQDDVDSDTLGDACDSCPLDAANDADSDTICGDVDNCPATPNTAQDDVDSDTFGDACDVCPLDAANDADSDTVCGDVDNCPATPNTAQDDVDSDTLGDACDFCPLDASNDTDNDTICGDVDNCPATPNTTQDDVDSDTFGDACDVCPLDAANDADSDTVCGDVDNCPATPNATQDDGDSDAVGDICDACPLDAANDADSDTICGDLDNCPATPNGTQDDTDSDTLGDACDVCPADASNDADSDTICGDVDNCPATPNGTQEDSDSDTLGDACDVCPLDAANDADSDTICGDLDNCPATPNTTQDDIDSDALGDVCDSCPLDPDNDIDSDNRCADEDNCPTVANTNQKDRDVDGLGDVCDPCPDDPTNDVDSDTVCGNSDNCPMLPNPTQDDFDLDGAGDECDLDDDNDGVDDIDDCVDFVPGVSSAPGMIGSNLRLSRIVEGTEVVWLNGVQGHTSNVYRGSLDAGQAWSTDLNCLVPETIDSLHVDPEDPAPGGLHYFLVSARNVCGESDAGETSGGMQTIPAAPCPTQGKDSDTDGVPDLEDNCPADSNPSQADSDGDFVGDACDI